MAGCALPVAQAPRSLRHRAGCSRGDRSAIYSRMPGLLKPYHRSSSAGANPPLSRSRLTTSPLMGYSNMAGVKDMGYGAMPRVEEALASYLSPTLASSLKKPALPSRLCRATSDLVGKAYMTVGRAGASLHTMAILQAYQANLLKDFDL